MKKSEFKSSLKELISSLEGFDDEFLKLEYVKNIIIDFKIQFESSNNLENKEKPWDDEALEIILSEASSKTNCLKYARLFKRGYGSIEQIYRWAGTPEGKMDDVRKEDSFIQQIHRIKKKLGLRA